MNAYPALVVAGIVFFLVAFVHLLRMIYKVEITVSGKVVPMSVSMIGLVVSLLLSIWMFMAS